MRAIDTVTGAAVTRGTEVEDYRGKVRVFVGTGRNGRVVISELDGSDRREVYAGLVGLRVVADADRGSISLPALCALVVAVLGILALVVTFGPSVSFYNGLNKGITVGSCGFEVVGTPGPFCGDY